MLGVRLFPDVVLVSRDAKGLPGARLRVLVILAGMIGLVSMAPGSTVLATGSSQLRTVAR